MRTLVTGAGGLLGSHVTTAAASRGQAIAVDRRPWWGTAPAVSTPGDLLQPGWIERIVADTAPSLIIHCAAMVDVDGCERDPALAESMNGILTRRIARAAPPGCRFVYISTDGLFDGTRPWVTEETLPCPRTAYGRSKLRGEWEVQLATDRHLIVRTNFFGWSSGRKRSSAEWVFHALEAAEPVTMFDDFFFTPMYIVDFVARLWTLIDRDVSGIVHLAGADRVTKHDFAIAMAAAAGFSAAHVRRGRLAEARLAADRPRDMSLRSVRLDSTGDLALPSCADGLRRFIADRNRPVHERLSGV